MKIVDLASAVAPNAEQELVGIRPGEKMHEQMIGIEDAPHTFEYGQYYKVLPAIHEWSQDENRIKNGKKVPKDFCYTSESNQNWLKASDLIQWVHENSHKFGLF